MALIAGNCFAVANPEDVIVTVTDQQRSVSSSASVLIGTDESDNDFKEATDFDFFDEMVSAQVNREGNETSADAFQDSQFDLATKQFQVGGTIETSATIGTATGSAQGESNFSMTFDVDILDGSGETEWAYELNIFMAAFHNVSTGNTTANISLFDHSAGTAVFAMVLDEQDALDIANPISSGSPDSGPLVITGLLNEGTYTFDVFLQSGFDEIESESGSSLVDFYALLLIPEPTTLSLLVFAMGILTVRRQSTYRH